MNTRLETAVVRFINWQIRHFTSKDFQRRLNRLIALGERKVLELRAEAIALEARMKNEPGWDPSSNSER